MKVICKCITDAEQLKSTCKICKFIELQLYNEFNESTSLETIKAVFVRVISNIGDAKIVTVHGPITDECASIEHVASPDRCSVVKATVFLANMFSEHYDNRVGVVLHNEVPSKYMEWFPEIYNDIRLNVKMWSDIYPNLDFYIENVVPFRTTKDKSTFCYHPGGTFDDNVKLVESLRRDVTNCNIYTLLDTAHAMITMHAEERMFHNENIIIPGQTIRDYMVRYKDTIKYMHLADGISLGLRPNQHGVSFNEYRHNILENILELYKELGFTCDICLEVTESDYLARDNFKDDYKDVCNICKQLGVDVENTI